MKKTDLLEMYRVENRFKRFIKNSLSIFTVGLAFGVGHFAAKTILKHGYDDVISLIKN